MYHNYGSFPEFDKTEVKFIRALLYKTDTEAEFINITEDMFPRFTSDDGIEYEAVTMSLDFCYRPDIDKCYMIDRPVYREVE